MATVHAFFPIARTRGNLTFYMMDGQNYVRKKSSLTARKVKTSKRFARTRYHAGIMAQASKIASALYQALPERWRQSWMYRTYTGEAMQLLKQGKTASATQEILYNLYVKEVVTKATVTPVVTQPVEACRTYTKRNTSYWIRKTVKAEKRKRQRQKLLQHAACLARASVMASRIYRSLLLKRANVGIYKAITGQVMALLKEGFEEALILQELRQPVIIPPLLVPLYRMRYLPPAFQQAC